MTTRGPFLSDAILQFRKYKGTLSIPKGRSKEFEVARDGILYKTDRPFQA